jgi:O-antigen/teichoic acid export membrane protein
MNGNLRTKVIHSFFWVFIDSFGQRIFQFIIGIILARLLLPEEFGLIGMIAVFITFSQLFIDSGFSFALIRKKEVTRIEYETVFWFNTSASLFFFIILWVTSPYIA